MTQDNLTIFSNIIRASNNRLTKARTETFKLLLTPEPQSLKQILDKAKGKIDRVSVYRNLWLFEKLDIVHRINFGWKYKLELSDKFMSHHHHLNCLSCGQVIDIKDEKHIDNFINQVSSKASFKPIRHLFEIEGYCVNCQDKI